MSLVQISDTQWVETDEVVSVFWDDALPGPAVELQGGKTYAAQRLPSDTPPSVRQRAITELVQTLQPRPPGLLRGGAALPPQVMEAPEGGTKVARVRHVVESWRASVRQSADNGYRNLVLAHVTQIEQALEGQP